MKPGDRVRCVKFSEEFTGTVQDFHPYGDDPTNCECHVRRDDTGETVFLVTTGGRSSVTPLTEVDDERELTRLLQIAVKQRNATEDALRRVHDERYEFKGQRDVAVELLRRGAVAHNHASREEWLREVAAFLKRGGVDG